LILNALLSAFEMAFVTVSKPELRKLTRSGKNAGAERLLKQRENPERVLSVLQIGITLVGAISAAVGGAGAEESLAPRIEEWLGVSERMSEAMAIIAIVIPLTYISVVFGELIPKTIALRHAVKIAITGSPWLSIADRVLNPVVALLESSTKLVTRFFPSNVAVEASGDVGAEVADLSEPHRQYVFNLVNIEKKRIRDIMVPWAQADFISNQATINEVLEKIVSCGHTRLPIFNGQDVIGFLHSKEFLVFVSSGDPIWQALIRTAVNVQLGDGLLATLRILQDQKKHMAIVRAAGRIEGIVTIEDIIEEVVGEIFDEDDDLYTKRLLALRLTRKTPAT
jgi:putative hemolysin